MDPLGTSNPDDSPQLHSPAWSQAGSQGRRRPGPGPLGPPSRQNTGQSNYGPGRTMPLDPLLAGANGRGTPGPGPRGPIPRLDSGMSGRGTWAPPMGPLPRQNSEISDRGTPGPGPMGPRQNSGFSGYAPTGRNSPIPIPSDPSERRTPGPQPLGPPERTPGPVMGPQAPVQEYEMRVQTPARDLQSAAANSKYQAFHPNMHASPIELPTKGRQTPSRGPAPQRNFTTPAQSQPQDDYFDQQSNFPQRSGTAPLPQAPTYDDSIYDSYGGGHEQPQPRPPKALRAATTNNPYNSQKSPPSYDW